MFGVPAYVSMRGYVAMVGIVGLVGSFHLTYI